MKSVLFRGRAALLAAAACAVVSTAFAPTAAAATYTGWTNPSGPDADGYQYFNNSSLTTTPRLYASTEQRTQNGSAAPTGHLGVLADLWKIGSNGISYICNENGYFYNDGPASSLSVPTIDQGCGVGTYYSRGVTKFFTGSTYAALYTFPTVNVPVS